MWLKDMFESLYSFDGYWRTVLCYKNGTEMSIFNLNGHLLAFSDIAVT